MSAAKLIRLFPQIKLFGIELDHVHWKLKGMHAFSYKGLRAIAFKRIQGGKTFFKLQGGGGSKR